MTALTAIDELRSHLPAVQSYVISRVESLRWSELERILAPRPDAPTGPLALLPLASCAAAGGHPEDAVPVASAWHVLNVAVRILDDLQDRDRPGLWNDVGDGRAFNYAAALHALALDLLVTAPWPADRCRAVMALFLSEALGLAAGQEDDLIGEHAGLEDYWQVMVDKNGRAFSLACGAGALATTSDPDLVQALRTYGLHLGLALQVFDDLEGVWGGEAGDDLASGRITFPVLYAMRAEHAGRDELITLARTRGTAADAERVRELLDAAGARQFGAWVALQEREQAIAALQPCPGAAGCAVLEAYVTAVFDRVEELLPG